MPLDPDFLEMLVCPACKTRLVPQGEQRLHCCACLRSYPVRDEIPILLLDEAILSEPETADEAAPA